MASSVIFEERVEIPYFPSLAEFRAWALSDDFPERGRIDYIGGRIEVDMSPENLFFHGSIKTEVVRVLANIVQSAGGGYLFSDRTRVSSPNADLSAEPDVVYVSADSIDSGPCPSGAQPQRRSGQLCGTGRRAGSGRGDRQRQFRRQGHEAIADFLLARRNCGVLAGRRASGSDCSSASTPAAGTVMSRRRWTPVASSFRRSSIIVSVSNVGATPAAAGYSTSSRGRANASRIRLAVP